MPRIQPKLTRSRRCIVADINAALAAGGPLYALTECAQFILWTTTEDGRKLPISPHTYQVCNAHDPAAHVTAADALAAAKPGYDVGFVFTKADPFYFLDIDGALDGNKWSPLALELLTALSGAAVEVSQSGRGLHIFGKSATLPHAKKNISLGIELYTSDRFVALTGTNALGNAGTDTTSALTAVVSRYFPVTPGTTPGDWTDEPVEEWGGPASDDDLLQKALATVSARSTFGGGASFADLWAADEDALGTAFPDSEGVRPYDASSADMALAQHLAFWTGKDCERMARIMRNSSLKREKWEREDYIHRTILRAVSLQERVYSPNYRPTAPASDEPPSAPVAPMAPGGIQVVTGLQYMGISQQPEHFRGCVYIVDLHRIFTPDGALLNPERFRAVYGGYLFALDNINDKTTKNAWEAFTESQGIHYPQANSTCFKPTLPPGDLSTEDGRTLVNVYVPIDTRRVKGDVTPFLEHMAKLLPDPDDQAILLAYMAACIQYKGVKFQWAPLIQGCEGNGKTLFTRCVARALGRRYAHIPKAADIDNKFNGWLLNKLLIGVEDIYVPGHKRELIETLKPMITAGDGIEIQFKGVDQITADICANFMLNSNHRDAIPKTNNDRRFAIFYTHQQYKGDLARDGMSGMYFPHLYDWLKLHDGYAIVAEYLETYQIPDALNPATHCHRAPDTSSTAAAITESLGGIEQEIIEAIDSGRPGFCGGWVSSHALHALLESLRMTRAVPPNKRRALMRDIGYDWHPALKDGRLNNPLPVIGGKPKIFIKNGHAGQHLSAAEVPAAFQAAQTQTAPQDAEPPGAVRPEA